MGVAVDIYNDNAEVRTGKDALIEDENLKEPVRSGLASHVLKCWREAKDFKRETENQMLRNLRQRRGEYEPEKLQAIHKQGISDLFLKLTDAKCRGAESWIRDVLLPAGDKPWTMEATPVPDLLPELRQMAIQKAMMDGLNQQDTERLQKAVLGKLKEDAEARAEAMEQLCEDQQVEGGFMTALDAIISDVVTLKAGIMKGPIFRQEPDLKWSRDFKPIVSSRIVMQFERVSPFDLYPAPGSVNCQRAAYLIEHHHLQPGDLEDLIGVSGYDDDAIFEVLENYSNSFANWLTLADDIREAARPEDERNLLLYNLSSEIDALQYHGQVRGDWLMEWGLTKRNLHPDRWYEAECWVIGSYCIKAKLNEHPLGLRPYYHTGAVKLNDQFWHQSVPELMDDAQDVVNASARSLVNNMAISSGPQIGLDESRLPQGFDWKTMHPWKVWPFKADDSGRDRQPITFFQPDNNAQALVAVLEKFKAWADELTGIPAYTQGIGNAQGAGKTASGLSMLMNAAAKGIRSIIFNIDKDIVEPMLYAQYVHNMLHHPDPSVKGDLHIKPRGAAALVVKEQMQLRRGEFLAQTANPIDMQIIGLPGRAELLREAVRALDMPVDRIIPTDEELKAQLMQAQQPQQQPMPPEQQPMQNLMPDGSPAGGQAFSQF